MEKGHYRRYSVYDIGKSTSQEIKTNTVLLWIFKNKQWEITFLGIKVTQFRLTW